MGLNYAAWLGLGVLVVGGCVEGEDTREPIGQHITELTMSSRAQVDQATLHANHGGTASTRTGTNAGQDGTGRVSWKLGGYTATEAGQVSVCNYGWCGWPSIGSGCQGDEDAWGYSYGACNSSAWGQRFGGYIENVDRPAGSGDQVHSNYEAGVSGTTTFGYHPYWSVLYNNECRTYQGWSYAGHGCSGTPYVVSEPSVCGDGTCQSDESCNSCTADCGICAPGPAGACELAFNASNTTSASYTDTDTDQFEIVLQAGTTYTISTCSTGTDDSYLRLHNGGSQVANNDDGCGSGYLSQFTYTPSSSGTFVLSAGCYNNTGCGGSVKIDPGDETACGTSGGGGGGGCTPSCAGDQCGQDDGCGGTCSAADAQACGMCGNAECCTPSCSGDQCGQADGCGGTCSAADAQTCGMCGNAECCTPSCSGDQCGQADGCGGTCAATDAQSCGMCGNAACTGGTCDGISYSTSSTGGASYTSGNTVKYEMQMTAGVTYTLSTCGSTSTDTYLRLHRNDSQVASNDDSCGTQSSITYTPTTSGTYIVGLGCYSNNSCSGTLSVSPDSSCSEVQQWSCSASYYNANDGCDCGCGTPDPDCGGQGCTEPGCGMAAGCDYAN